jgi:hypothetical protein
MRWALRIERSQFGHNLKKKSRCKLAATRRRAKPSLFQIVVQLVLMLALHWLRVRVYSPIIGTAGGQHGQY